MRDRGESLLRRNNKEVVDRGKRNNNELSDEEECEVKS
jgi:hypothetical protein